MEWEIREFAAPDAVALNRVGPRIAYAPQAAVKLDVAAGETATWEFDHTPEDRYADGNASERPMRFHLQWRGGRLTREVTVEME